MQCTSIARMGMMRDVSEMVRSCSQGSQLLLRLDALLTWLYAVCKRDTEPSHGGWLGKIASDTGQSRDFGSVAKACIDGSVMSGNHRPDASLGSCSMPANGAIVVQFIQMPLGRCPEARPLDLTRLYLLKNGRRRHRDVAPDPEHPLSRAAARVQLFC